MKRQDDCDFDRGAIYGLRASLAGFLDDRSSRPRLKMVSAFSEENELTNDALHIREAILWIKQLEDKLAEEDK